MCVRIILLFVVRPSVAVKSSTGSNEISKSAEDTVPVDFSKIDNRLPLKIQDSERTEYVSPVSRNNVLNFTLNMCNWICKNMIDKCSQILVV